MTTSTTGPVHNSHRNTTSETGGSNRQQESPRSSATRGVSSPWKQVVRIGESESTIAVTSSSPPLSPQGSCEQDVHSSDCSPPEQADSASSLDATTEAQIENSDNGSSDGTNGNGAKKQAWNKPSNGAADLSPVMGAVSWPALSDSAKASPKLSSSSSDLLKTPSRSVSLSQVMELTDNIQLILNAVRFSTVVEVQGEKLRRRNEWFHWLLPPSVQNSTVSNPQSLHKSTPDLLVENFQRVAFDDKTVRHGNAEAHLSRSSSAELSTPSEQFGNEMARQAGGQHWQPMPVGNPS